VKNGVTCVHEEDQQLTRSSSLVQG